MKDYSHNKRTILATLGIIFIFSSLAIPKGAFALVPVAEGGPALPKIAVTALESIATTIQDTLIKTFSEWDTFKARVLDPLAKTILQKLIREMKRMAINYIVTGDAGLPTFVTNFETDIKKVAENAARSYLSQLTGINFCSFFPPIEQSVISLNFNLQFACTVNGDLYARYLNAPQLLTEMEELLVLDPRANFLETVVNTGRVKTEQLAQAAVARAAEISAGNGLFGDSENITTATDRAAATAATQQNAERARQAAIADAEATANPEGAQQAGDLAYSYALRNQVTEPKQTKRIKTPGAAVSATLSQALGSDWTYPEVADEFDQAVLQIADVAFGQMFNKGLADIFK